MVLEKRKYLRMNKLLLFSDARLTLFLSGVYTNVRQWRGLANGKKRHGGVERKQDGGCIGTKRKTVCLIEARKRKQEGGEEG